MWNYQVFKEGNVQRPLRKFVAWQQCATVMQREAVTYAKL